MKEGNAEQPHGAHEKWIMRCPPCVDKMRVVTEAATKLPRARPITGHHAPPATLVCGAIGVLQAAGRTRVFGTQASSLRRRSLYP